MQLYTGKVHDSNINMHRIKFYLITNKTPVMTECDKDPSKCTTTSTAMNFTSGESTIQQSTISGNSEMFIFVYC